MQSTNQPETPPPKTSAAETDTGEAQSTGTATGTTETTAPHPGVGVSVGKKLKGAVHVIHGAGEELRGSILGAFDTVRGKDVSQTEAGQISGKGKEEIYKGMEALRSGHYAGGATARAAPVAEAQGGQPTAPPQRDEPAAAAGTRLGKDVPRAEEGTQAPPSQRDEAAGAGAGAGLGMDVPQAQGSQSVLPPLHRTAGGNEAETKTKAAPGEYQVSYGVRDNQSAPGNVAASHAEGQGIDQQTREETGGPPAGERGPYPTTAAQQS